ncbi:MAG: hypothetical protein EOS65_02505 [Mesorhizobium sp.]|uniref:hypothetical protein n=1 Tax=Mesorhizobium sp. TaxID=1871066 RepID=UPI000FE64442|nr:hypothetical protein [Mesorhizobium sp.]RWF44267.1 MAG: hypothetical protein EOS65_02505 [Mesorhizobium sp.]
MTSMLHVSIPLAPFDQVHRKLPRGLQDRDLGICIRDDDVNGWDVKNPASDAALRHQNVAGNRAHVFDAAEARNEEFRHSSRVEHAHFVASREPGSCRFSLPAHDQAGAFRGASSTANFDVFSSSFAHSLRDVNAFNGGLIGSRSAFMSDVSTSHSLPSPTLAGATNSPAFSSGASLKGDA